MPHLPHHCCFSQILYCCSTTAYIFLSSSYGGALLDPPDWPRFVIQLPHLFFLRAQVAIWIKGAQGNMEAVSDTSQQLLACCLLGVDALRGSAAEFSERQTDESDSVKSKHITQIEQSQE